MQAPPILASFPGSGNTWLRFAIQRSTGLTTGSVYDDNSIRDDGVLGEGLSVGVVGVKTHFPALYRKGQDDDLLGRRSPVRAVVVLRHPWDTFFSWCQLYVLSGKDRGKGGGKNGTDWHVAEAPEKKVRDCMDKTIDQKVQKWSQFYDFWVEGKVLSPHPKLKPPEEKLVIQFNDLRSDFANIFPQVLRFLGISADAEHLKCASSSTAKRSHSKKKPFKETDVDHMQKLQTKMRALNYSMMV